MSLYLVRLLRCERRLLFRDGFSLGESERDEGGMREDVGKVGMGKGGGRRGGESTRSVLSQFQPLYVKELTADMLPCSMA